APAQEQLSDSVEAADEAAPIVPDAVLPEPVAAAPASEDAVAEAPVEAALESDTAPAPEAEAAPAPEAEADAAPAEPEFDEVWFPGGRRNDNRRHEGRSRRDGGAEGQQPK